MPNPVTHCLCLLAGAYSLGTLGRLPPEPVAAVVMAAALALCLISPLRPLAGFAAGAAMMGLAAQAQLGDRLSGALTGVDLRVVGRIEGFPVRRDGTLAFIIRPDSRGTLPARIRLSWIDAGAEPRIGERWHLQVRLRPPRGNANPGGFDFEGWSFREHIGATGYVLAQGHNYRIYGSPTGIVDRLRGHVVERLAMLLPSGEPAAVLQAVAAGARQDITRSQWETYAATGTSHLMAISGLHIGLAAGCGFVFCWVVLAALPGQRNIRDPALAGALVIALAYATLSGFAVPAQRALLMLLLAGIAILQRRRVEPSGILAFAGILVFVSDPLAILAPGFQLSFAAVAILLVIGGRGAGTVTSAPWSARLARTTMQLWSLQIGLLFGLYPLTVLLFGRFSLAAPFVNLLVLPAFNLVTVPLTLAGVALDGPFAAAGDQLLWLALHSVRAVLAVIHASAGLQVLSFRPAAASLLAVLLPVIFVVAPVGWPGRRLALVSIVVALAARPPPPPSGCLRFHVLDVGQGLAVVVQTQAHALLYDTGPAYRTGGSAADFVVLPFLQHAGIHRLNIVIVSHSDLDHAGGLSSISAGLAVDGIVSGEPLDDNSPFYPRCTAGVEWAWDGVLFRVLHPRADYGWTGNNSSCVIEVSTGGQIVLLAGDIETPVERLLVHRSVLHPAHAVVVPHHGSRTSSSAPFVAATRPRLAIMSTGFGNRWGFPKDDVAERWRGTGATVLDTAVSGAISQQLCADRAPGAVVETRVESARYWRDFSAGAG